MLTSKLRRGPLVTQGGYVHKKSFKGHKDVVNCFALGDNHLFTASNDHTIKVWVLETGSLKASLTGHGQGVCCLMLNDGALYSGSFDSVIKKWDIKEMACVQTYHGHSEAVYALSVSGGFVVSGSRDKTVRVFQESTGKVTATLKGHSGPVLALIVSDRLMYSGSDDTTIKLWDWRSGAEVRTYYGHQAGVTALKLADPQLYSASFDATLRLWNTGNGQCMRVCKADAGLKSLDLGGGKLFGAGNNACMYVWDLQSSSETPLSADRLARAGLTSIVLDGNSVYTSSADNVVRQWEKVSNAVAVQGGGGGEGGRGKRLVYPPGASAYMGDLAGNSDDGESREGDGEDEGEEDEQEQEQEGEGEERATEGGGREKPVKRDEAMLNSYTGVHGDKVHCVVSHGDRIFTASSDTRVGIMTCMEGGGRSSSEAELDLMRGHTDRVLCLVVAPDGRAVFSGSADATIRKWEVPAEGGVGRGKEIGRLSGHSDWVSCLHIDAGGSLYSGSWDRTIRKWDITALRFITEITGHSDPVYCLTSCGGVLFSGSRDCTVRGWSVESNDCVRVYEGHKAAVSAVVVVDPHLYTASWDKTVRCFDVATGAQMQRFPSFSQPVLCLEVSHGGLIFTGGSDMKVRCFQLPGLKQLRTYSRHTQAVNSLALRKASGGGTVLYSASDDGDVVAWNVPETEDKYAEQNPVALISRIQAAPPQQRSGGGVPGSLTARLVGSSVEGDVGKVAQPAQGWLVKQGSLFKRWSKRYYTLDKGVILCYADMPSRGAAKPLDHITMKDLLSVSPAGPDARVPNGMFGFSLVTIDRKQLLAALTKESYRQWMAALKIYVENNHMAEAIKQKRETRKY